MTPALREAATKGICFSSLPSTMESDKMLCMEGPRTVDEKLKGDTFSQMLGFPTPEPTLSTNFVNLKHFGSPQSSKHYQTVLLMSSNATLNKYSENYKQKKLGEPHCNKLKNIVCNGSNIQLSKICHSPSEEFIKKEPLSDTTSQCMTDVQTILDSDITKDTNVDKGQLKNCKWYQKNALLGKDSDAEIKKGLLHCAQNKIGPDHSNVPISSSTAGKEEEVNARLLHCVSKQKILLSQARRTQKHLQMLLAKHVVKHCGQQMKFSMEHQLPKMKTFHEPTTILDNSLPKCTEIKPDINLLTAENKLWNDTKNGFARCTAAEIQRFALSATGLLSHVEEGLDSDATDSSSDDDLDEYTIRKNVSVNCSTEWKWLVDRARVGSRWTWLQAQISELEYKIQQLTDVHRQIRASKGIVILEECRLPKDILKKQIQFTDQAASLNTTGSPQIPQECQDPLPEQDFEMSPSSPTLLLRNIEKQSAQLTEIISSLIAPLNFSPTSSPLSSKSCSHKCLANGISRSASENLDGLSSSSSWLLNQKHSKKRRKDRTRLKSPSLTVMSTAARTRPLQSFHKRKLYRLSPTFYWTPQTLPSKETRFLNTTQMPCLQSSSIWSSCEHNSKSQILTEHVSELDSAFHSVLSLPSDVPLRFHFETLFKKTEIKGDLSENKFVGDYIISPSPVHNTSLNQWRNGYSPICKPQMRSESSAQLLQGRKKRHLSETALEERTRFEEFAIQRTEPGSQSNFTAVTNVNVISRAQNSSSQNTARRRLRSESSYDIDNIVIPMSLVAPAKLEKLQYKEIVTPSWRMVVLQPLDAYNLGEEEIEDLSDAVFSLRHKKYEEKEQARWSLWEQSKWHRRNSRAYSKNAEGQDLLLKEYPNDFSGGQHCAAEGPAEPASESQDPSAHASPSVGQSQETKSLGWERRAFPLKDEDIAALLCQDEKNDQIERSSPPFHGEVFCTSAPENGHHPQRQADGMEEHKTLGLGLTHVKKNQ
ncbi:KAT8 regulatory NSL complex subunit 1-like protein isoform X1 [Kogia breviceps]|uniref:KAT8 regulatory NSL complex subunit 1-like protein isoform X1 n=1 Tax=Kogia breviceps TaxID=27615 RepID=UPI002795C243|nr:KAT8 regulatory NSL complex subunit 1-like protein isoform X1 [Kogia breviceps]XP_058909740.1 KAT8 regulatory NSL complex subunit 1-like protein isoform X1 [Kogia breviceps]XP_058909741.1 KAT8 regulatory NSL complex subunit 1-like protein isoform X1 [Kogia breviceps]XP_058909742.1 KAT8 regulatory NSL complex subunit 1-like protein isoform X1 [Kogia breviceps]XP_058909743.1 KAT8 regulatory NSL complex subunit 1-like protein isoform X1 [Kogia breviceps]